MQLEGGGRNESNRAAEPMGTPRGASAGGNVYTQEHTGRRKGIRGEG